jgi:hypothetical protein
MHIIAVFVNNCSDAEFFFFRNFTLTSKIISSHYLLSLLNLHSTVIPRDRKEIDRVSHDSHGSVGSAGCTCQT